MADNLLDYIRENPNETTAGLWSGLAFARDITEQHVGPSMPQNHDELSKQLQVLLQIGQIECKDGRWQALEIRRPQPSKQTSFLK